MMKKRIIIIASILIIFLLVVIGIVLNKKVEFPENSVIAYMSDWNGISYEIYSTGRIEFSNGNNAQISETELEELKKLIFARVKDPRIINPSGETSEGFFTVVDEYWSGMVYYGDKSISLNYNISQTNSALRSYIWKLSEKYFKE